MSYIDKITPVQIKGAAINEFVSGTLEISNTYQTGFPLRYTFIKDTFVDHFLIDKNFPITKTKASATVESGTTEVKLVEYLGNLSTFSGYTFEFDMTYSNVKDQIREKRKIYYYDCIEFTAATTSLLIDTVKSGIFSISFTGLVNENETTIDWGDGTQTTVDTNSTATHIYSDNSLKTITIVFSDPVYSITSRDSDIVNSVNLASPFFDTLTLVDFKNNQIESFTVGGFVNNDNLILNLQNNSLTNSAMIDLLTMVNDIGISGNLRYVNILQNAYPNSIVTNLQTVLGTKNILVLLLILLDQNSEPFKTEDGIFIEQEDAD